MNRTMVNTEYRQTEEAESLEEILCLSVLIAKGNLPYFATIEDSKRVYKEIGEDCNNCPWNSVCLACIINE